MTPLARSVLKPTELGSLGWLPNLQILEVPPRVFFTTHVMYYCDDVLETALLFCVDFINGL